MSVFHYCMNAICKESGKFNMFFNKETCKINNSTDENFDLPAVRLAYIYKFGIFNVHFFKKCISTFTTNCSESSKVLKKIHSSKMICSLSNGPGTDLIGLLFAFQENGMALNKRISFQIISKTGAWRNSMNALISVKGPGIPTFGAFDLLQCDILKFFSSKTQTCLIEADVVLMDHPFASPKIKKKTILKIFETILQILKPHAYVFIIDTETRLPYFESVSTDGSFIYGPTEIELENIPCDENIIQTIGEQPIRSGKAHFGIWQKSDLPKKIASDKSMLINVVPAVRKSTDYVANSNGNTPSHKFNPETSSTDTSSPKKALANIADSFRNFNFTKTSNQAILTENTGESKETMCDINSDSHLIDTKSSRLHHENDISTVLKSFDCLITKLEEFVDSEIISESFDSSSHFQQMQPCSKWHNHNCCNNIHYACTCVHSCSYKAAPSAYSCVHNVCKCVTKRSECVNNHTNDVQNIFNNDTSFYQTHPHIVIPLQNITAECITQVMSLTSKKES